MSLFPDDRVVPEDAINGIQVRLSELELRNPRVFGNCWLASELWEQLGLDEFWQERLPQGREAIGWDKVLRLLVVNRLIEPGSEFRLHRHWFLSSAMDELLNTDFLVAEKDRLYRCLDRVLEHKRDLFVFFVLFQNEVVVRSHRVHAGRSRQQPVRRAGKKRIQYTL